MPGSSWTLYWPSQPTAELTNSRPLPSRKGAAVLQLSCASTPSVFNDPRLRNGVATVTIWPVASRCISLQ